MNLANDKSEFSEVDSGSAIATCAETVRQWAHGFRPEAQILQIGFEGGTIPQLLIDAGLCLHLVENSRTRLAIFRQMFPEVASACSDAPCWDLFSRTFDGVLLSGSARGMSEAMRVAQFARIERLLRVCGRVLIIIRPANQAAIDPRSEPGGTRSAKGLCERILHKSGLDILPRLRDRSGNEYVAAIKHVQAGVPH